MNKKILGTLLISGGLALSQSALANGFSIGLMAGQANDSSLGNTCNEVINTTTTSNFFSCSNDDSDTALGINVSYKLDDYFGLEAGYVDLGEMVSTLTGTNAELGISTSSDITLEQQATYLAGTVSFNLGEKWSLTGRAGYFDLSGDLNSPRAETSFEEDADFYFGTSVDFHVTERITAQLRYDNFDANVISGGLKFNF